jgi:CelD/BcsL family acetyltransferase involved in cellulose biosynthesis
MAAPTSTGIDFTIGARRLLRVPRQLATWAFTLDQLRAEALPPAPPGGPDGVRVLSAPTGRLAEVTACYPGFIRGGRQDYRRHYIAMDGSFAAYLAGFSGKTRATLRRKAKKLAEATGGYTVTAHRTPAEIEAFLAAALPLSARTYQARLLGAGLPDSAEARRAMLAAAEADALRCFLLHADGEAIAYLALPVVGRTLIYAHLGYHPACAPLSPGTVLQIEALERLFAEQRFAHFDFTEGEGAHKALFGTGWVACSSQILLEPTVANRTLLTARAGFDGAVSTAKALAERSGMLGRVRSAIRS